MRLFGLLGYPLGHSFSAAYFHDKFTHEGIDADYRNFAFSNIDDAMTSLKAEAELCGFNVTIPYKQAVIPFLDELSDEAREMGAVNVVRVSRNPDGSVALKGMNSDLVGFRETIRPLLDASHRKALVLGTGGASKAVHYGLRQLGIETFSVSRTPKVGGLTYADLTSEVMGICTVVVNCTPLGMFPKTDACPNIPYELLTPHHVLYDLVYNPTETLFMKKGAAQGAVVKNGLDMLHLQAEEAWRMWND